ncbi:NAD(P)/FAD-dependent oxidoreductase [Nodosilinea sp. LEGE 06152]|uniref:NAD(P)/FAD-dependent oxidoreductase n=1 Tax=Nodosilinea sp. LEGE 06152 TaxID=2777966 RepID=UPI001882E93B|nr:NAD(P)/FAD-dependent oxidoreductase [Nodosilinea sp. LEGE 06152]MBE9159246.1 NAD(P)/FAD-dependent oxidoreductase [Nodosilinea sp. LEGE 06152]
MPPKPFANAPGDHAALRPSGPSPEGATQVCILGGGFGGLYCALALHQRLGKASRLRITLVEPRDRFNFTPLLYELLTHELAPWEIAPAYRDLLRHTAVDLRQDWAEHIDLAQQTVILRHGEPITYDYLVVALGSQMRPPATPGSQTHTLPFNTLQDAEQLERRLGELDHLPKVRVVVAGAGPSGVELACKLSDRLSSRGHVTIVDRRGEILRSYPERVQRAAARALAKRGVEVYLNAAITAVEDSGLTFRYEDKTRHCQAELMLWTVGTVPRSWLGKNDLKQTAFGQCQVEPTLQLPNHNNVFVLGDMAAMPAPKRDRAPTTAQAAYQAGPAVAQNVLALIANRPLKPFVYNHLGDMLTLGQGEAVVCGFGLCITGQLGGLSRRWAYWLRLPTHTHRWRVLKHWLGFKP